MSIRPAISVGLLLGTLVPVVTGTVLIPRAAATELFMILIFVQTLLFFIPGMYLAMTDDPTRTI